MKLRLHKFLMLLMALSLVFSVSGVYAIWVYFSPPKTSQKDISVQMNEFVFGPPEDLYISAVELVSATSGVSNLDFGYSLLTNHTASAKISQRNSQVTYKITVHNNTGVVRWYFGPLAESDYPSNDAVGVTGGITLVTKDKPGDTSATFNTNDYVLPYTTRDFYVTYTYGVSATGDVSTLINFRFGIKMDAVYDGFLAVLNDQTSNHGYHYLTDVFDEKYAEDGTMVIGNVGEDKAIFDHIFGEDLTISVDGIEVPVTVMVERRNVDGRTTGDSYNGGTPSGCEYTVYITVDPLNSPTGKAMVHAISYSCKDTGLWYQIGQLYEGTADIVDYDTTNGTYEGAVDVTTWIAEPKTYVVYNNTSDPGKNIQYSAGQLYQGTNYDKLKTIDEIMSTDDQEIYNKIDNSGVLKRTYDILRANQGVETPEVVNLRTAFEAMEPYFNNYNNGQQFQMKRIATRAEILPYVAKLCDAYDYYLQVHG